MKSIIIIPTENNNLFYDKDYDEIALHMDLNKVIDCIFEHANYDPDIIPNAIIKKLKDEGYDAINETKLLQFLLKNLINNYEDEYGINDNILKLALKVIKDI